MLKNILIRLGYTLKLFVVTPISFVIGMALLTLVVAINTVIEMGIQLVDIWGDIFLPADYKG